MSTRRAVSREDPVTDQDALVERFHRVLVESIRDESPSYLEGTFTVAEIYQSLVPYRTHRDRLGLEMNGDYEDTLLRLLAGEGQFLELDSKTARERIRKELGSRNPNTGIYREFAAAEVRLNPDRVSSGLRPGSAVSGTVPDEDPPGVVVPEIETVATETLAPVPAPENETSSEGSTDGPKDAGVRPRRNGSGVTAASAQGGVAECPDCGEALPARESLRFCPFCGANTRVAPCRECGEMLERTWQFCVACGTPTGD